MIKTNLIYVYVGVNGTVVNNDFNFCIFLGYDPDELVWPPTVRMFVRTYMNNNVNDNEYELYEPELMYWLVNRLKQ